MQGEKSAAAGGVVLFCEECGRRNSYDDAGEIESNGGYTCAFCDFFTPLYASSALRMVKEKSSPQGPFIGWQPQTIAFGEVSSRAGASKRFIVYPEAEGERFDLEVEPVARLRETLSVSELESQVYLVTVLPVRQSEGALVDYHGPGLTVRDRRTGRKVEITVTFERTSPKLEIDRSQVNLGRIPAGKIHEDFVVVKNGGNEMLHLQVMPDPNYYSIATQFTVDSPSSLFIDPGEKRKISFTLWPTEEISSNWSYFQPICLQSNELSRTNKRNIVITCVVSRT